MQRVPDHSIFSQNRKRRFKDSMIFRDIFNEIVLQCIQPGIVSGGTGVADGSFLPFIASWKSKYDAVETVNRSTIKYLMELDDELSSMLGYTKPETKELQDECMKSHIDPEYGYIHQVRKKASYGNDSRHKAWHHYRGRLLSC